MGEELEVRRLAVQRVEDRRTQREVAAFLGVHPGHGGSMGSPVPE